MSIYERFERYFEVTFARAAERYLLEFQKRDKKRTESAIASVLPYIGSLRLIDVDDEALRQFKHDRLNGVGHFTRPAMVGTVNKELTQAATILNKACKIWRMIPSAPRFEHVTGVHRHAHPLSWAEQDRLFQALPTGWDVGVGCFAVNTGVRKEELFGMTWGDIVDVPEIGPDIFVGILNHTKNGKARAVICNSIARRAVLMQKKWQAKHGQNEFIFPKKQCPSSNGKTWQVAWAKAGLPTDKLTKRGIHNCRHTFAHRLRAAGVPEEDRNALLGHHTTNLAQHYAMPDVRRLLAAAELITVRSETTVLRSSHLSDATNFKH